MTELEWPLDLPLRSDSRQRKKPKGRREDEGLREVKSKLARREVDCDFVSGHALTAVLRLADDPSKP